MKNIAKHLLLFLACIGTSASFAQEVDLTNLESRIDSLIPESISDDTPGLVLGVLHKGELVYSKGFGMANLSYGLKNDPEMVYNIGSVTKQFLGFAFAILHVKGTLNIDDPVGNYLEDWPEFEHEVTLRHILTHTSGYREAYTVSNLSGRFIGIDRLTREECLDVVRRQPKLEFVPGSQYTYNSTAWVILAEILESATGISADTWVENYILEPLQMNDTQIESYVGEVITNAAESYSYAEGQGYVNEKSNRAIFGASDIWTNVPDLAKWLNNMKLAQQSDSAIMNLFLDPFILNDGTNSEYALGIGVGTYRGLRMYRHNGGHEAFATQLAYFPDQDLGFITVSNFGGQGWLSISNIADFMLADFFEEPSSKKKKTKKVKVSGKDLEAYAGIYVGSNFNSTYELKVENDSLKTVRGTYLIPTAKNSFKIDGWSGSFQLQEREDGGLNLIVEDRGKDTYSKVERWENAQSELEQYAGDYWSDELETVYHLDVKNDTLTVTHRWLGEIQLMPFSKDFFKTNWGYHVRFKRDDQGELSGLSVYSGRTLDVFFRKEE